MSTFITGQVLGAAARRGRRPAFTLLEITLAMTLGALVVLACFGLFGVLSRADRRHEARFGETLQVGAAHRTLGRALRTLVMSDTTPPPEDRPNRGFGPATRPEVERSQPTEEQQREARFPRFIVEFDPAVPARMSGLSNEEFVASRTLQRPQRMAVALSVPPVFPPPDAADRAAAVRRAIAEVEAERGIGTMSERREGAQARRRREDMDRGRDAADLRAAIGESEDDDAVIREPALAQGVRGVFELRPDDWQPGDDALGGVPGRDGRSMLIRAGSFDDPSREVGWTLWWREMGASGSLRSWSEEDWEDSPSAPDRFLAERDAALEMSAPRVKLMSGLRHLSFEVFDDGEFHEERQSVWAQQLPAYVNVRWELLSGRRGQWMFEVGWINGKSPGTLLNPGTQAPELIDTDGDGIPDSPAPGGPDGGGDGAGGKGGGDGGAGGGSGKGGSEPATGGKGGGRPATNERGGRGGAGGRGTGGRSESGDGKGGGR